MPEGGSDPERLQDRLAIIEARLKALAAAEDSASWKQPGAGRGGFRQEQANLSAEAERIRAQLEGRG